MKRLSLLLLSSLSTLLFIACDPTPQPNPDPEPDPVPADSLTRIVLTEDSVTNFANPERGFHHFCEFNTTSPKTLYASTLNSYREQGFSLVVTIYYMPDFRDCAITEEWLNIIRQNMVILRENGFKCILRFAYTNSESQLPHEAPVDTVLMHIAQLKPILQENADVIFTMEAGFVGTWGEWYYTTYFKASPVTKADFETRRQVLDAELDALPSTRMICVRTPEFKMKCFDWGLADTLTRETAYDGSAKARIAAHDDAFMANSSDMGTFNSSTQRKFWEADTKYTIYGGESCQPGTYANAENSIAQMRAMHISYLNTDYHKSVIQGWQKEGRLDEIKRIIGYRLVAQNVGYKKATANQPFRLEVVLTNRGCSSPKNPRDLYMILVDKATGKAYSNKLEDDPRFWFSDETQIISSLFNVPAGKYDVCLYLPDPEPTLTADPRYAIRFANENVWDEKTGYNHLAEITVE